jgi:hypothetical protein
MRFARQQGYQIVYVSHRFPADNEELGDIDNSCASRRLGIHQEGFVDALFIPTVLNPILVGFSILEPG